MRRGRILHALLFLLLGIGVVPLLFTSFQLVSQGRDILELDQKTMQLDKARSLSQQVAVYVRSVQAQIAAIARTLEVDSLPGQFKERVTRIRETRDMERYVGGNSPLYYVSVIDTTGSGARSGVQFPEPAIEDMLQEGYLRALQGQSMLGDPILSASVQEPVVVLSEPVRGPRGGVLGVVLAVANLGPLWKMTEDMGQEGLFEVYVVDRRGRLVTHSNPGKLEGDLDFSQVEIVKQFLASQGRTAATVPFTLPAEGGEVRMLGTYTGIPETGWGVLVQIDEAKAYYSVFEMRKQALVLVVLVGLVAVLMGSIFARHISHPIDELARGARRLASGDYTTRVPVKARNEVGVLGDAFNQMGAEVQKAIEEVRRSARRNKELFMGSIRMLANAIDEKDPYTRGHSERVAFYSMLMAKHMGMSEEEIERVHLSGIIHDVGKIGIEDKILRKPAALTEEEYEMMKQHPKKGEHILKAVPLLYSRNFSTPQSFITYLSRARRRSARLP